MLWVLVVVIAVTYFLLDWLIRLPKVGNHGNKYVFITGCDSGFGRDLVIRLEKLGFHVFAGCLSEDGRQSLAEICSDHVITLRLDVTKTDSIEAAFQEVKRQIPDEKSLWAVVNNAGIIGLSGTPEICLKKDYMDACDVNLFDPIEVSRIFMPLLRKSQGRIINMISMAGRIAIAAVPYSVSKFGMEAFTDALRREVSKFGVKVCALEPGFFRTPLLSADRTGSMTAAAYDRSSSEVKTAYGSDYPAKFKAVMAGIIAMSSSEVHMVVDTYVAALTSKYPRPRYVVGNDVKFAAVMIPFLPEWVADWLSASWQRKAWKARG